MKIMKEVTISASKEEIWGWLTDSDNLRQIWGSGLEVDLRKNGFMSIRDSGKSWRIGSIRPPEKLTFSANAPSAPTITTVELCPRGKRTSVKVSINGWDKVDPEKARVEMPRISLQWEKSLNSIKKSIESNSRRKMPST